MAPSETKAKSNCCSSSSATTTLSRKRKKSSSKCLISISSTWYSLFVVLIHIYLIKTHIETILDLKPLGQTHDTINQTMANNLFTLLRQEVDEALSSELIVRVLSVSISLLFLSLFVLASLQRCANYANDSVKFGRDFFAEQLHHHRKHISYDKAKSPTSKTSNDSGRGTTTAESSSDSASSISSTSIKLKRRGCRCITGLRRLGEHMWRHFLPFAPLAHILSVVILILPDLVYPAVHSVRDRIDRAYANTSDCFRQEGFINAENAFNISRASNCIVDVFFKPNSGLLAKFLTSAAVNTTGSNDLYKEYFFDQIRIYAIEIISLSLAFATLSIRYGSVFWYTNKTLSYIITLIGFVSSVQQLFQLYAFSYLNQQITTIRFERVVKMFLSELLVSSKMPTRADLNALESRMSFKLTPFSYFSSQPASMTASNSSLLNQDYDEMFIINSRLKLVFTYAVLGALVILTLIPAYAFVYLKYKERFLLEEAHFLSALLNEHQHLTKPSASQHTTVLRRSETSASKIRQCDDEIRFDQMSLLTDETNKFEPCKLIWDENKMLGGGEVENGATTLALALELNKSGCCFNYCPHLIATIQLILICLCKLPFCYDFIMYFEMSTQKDFGIMLCIIIEILHTVVLLFIWLLLTLKTEWSMHLRASYSICHWTYHLRHHHMQRRRLRRQSTSTNEHQVSSSSATFTNIQTSEKVVIKGDENSRSMEMSMKLTQEPIQSKRCSLAREDHFDNSVDDEDDDYRNQTTIVSHQHLQHSNTSNDQSVVAASFRRIGATATNTTSSTSSEDLLASETMYRNQIRKSIRNVLQHKRNSAIAIPIVNENGCESMRTTNRYHFQPQPQFKIISPPSIQSSTITSNGRAVQPVARLLGTGVYLTTSPSFAAESSASNNGQFLTTASTPKPLQPHQQHPSAPTITTILTSSVFEIPPQQQSQSVLYLNRPHSKEYESRV